MQCSLIANIGLEVMETRQGHVFEIIYLLQTENDKCQTRPFVRESTQQRQESNFKQANTQESEKLSGGGGKHKWKRAKYNHVQEKATKRAKQIPSGI
jgi:hypothetical protein